MFVIAILSCSFISADQPEKVEALSSKVILESADGYFVLSDGSYWKVVQFVKRWRTPSEWWNNIALVPKNYECTPSDWFLGSQIEVFSKQETTLTVDEMNASNHETLKKCTHILWNARTDQGLFAIALDPADCIVQLHNDARSEGYNKGLRDGLQKSSKNSSEAYDKGYTDGYNAGFREGVQGVPTAN